MIMKSDCKSELGRNFVWKSKNSKNVSNFLKKLIPDFKQQAMQKIHINLLKTFMTITHYTLPQLCVALRVKCEKSISEWTSINIYYKSCSNKFGQLIPYRS